MNNPKEEIESVAALIGSTQAQLAALDENIVGESTNLKRGQFDGKQILQKRMQQAAQEYGGGNQPPPPSQPQPQPQHVVQQIPPAGIHPEVQQPQPVIQHVVQPQPVQQNYGSELQIVLQKLVSIEDEIKGLNARIDGIEYFDKKVIDSLTKGLQNKVKQVTIKLDDVKDNKQK